MEVGKIYINGQIGAYDGEIGVNLKDVITQVQAQPTATSFDVIINSQGGYVDIGFDIYEYLVSLKKTGTTINTIGVGMVASIATVIFMAGDRRTLKQGTEFMIHLPSGGVEGTADEISQYSQMLKETENKLVKFYKETTGLTEEAVRPLLRVETWLNSDDALTMGFVNEQTFELNAVAKFTSINKNDNTKMTEADKSWIEEQFTKFTALFKGKAKNIVLLDSNGAELEFPALEDGQTPAVGDEVLVGGEPADGEYIMPQLANAIVVCVGGKVTEIKEAEMEDDAEALKAENESLKQKLAEMEAKANGAEAKATEAETKLSTIETEFTNFKAQVTAKFETRKEERKKDEPAKNVAQERLEKLKNKNKK